MISWSFYLVGGVTVGSAIAAMALRNIVHSVLLLVITFGGLSVLYLQLDAQFIAFAQILIYVGAVAILVVFAILLTQGTDAGGDARAATGLWCGLIIALVAFVVLAKAFLGSPALRQVSTKGPSTSAAAIGRELMGGYVLPLEIVGVLLTAAMVGAAVIALQERRK